jgi:Tfp pilus assembly protein PilN
VISKSYKRIFVAIIFPVFLCVAVVIRFQVQIDHQQERNDYLSKQLSLIEENLGNLDNISSLRFEMMELLHLIQQVGSATHYGPVHILNDISYEISDDISLQSVYLREEVLVLEGKTNNKESAETFRDRLLSRKYLSIGSGDNLFVISEGSHFNFKLFLKLSRSDVVDRDAS